MPKLLFGDYLIGGFLIIILATVFISDGIIGGLITLLGIVGGLFLFLSIIFGAYKVVKNDGFNALVSKTTESLLKFFFTGALILTMFSFLWVGAKIFISGLGWLKDGFWFYEHHSLCSVLEFNCFPNTGFVKINQFIAWLYGFDIEFWIIVAPWALATLFWFLDAPTEKKST